MKRQSISSATTRDYETTVKEFITNKKGELKKIRTVKVKFENRRMIEVPGTEQELSCQLLLIAAGFIGCEPATADAFGIPLGKRGTIETECSRRATVTEASLWSSGQSPKDVPAHAR